MGSFIEVNDTLQITKEQGFPVIRLNGPWTISRLRSR